MNINFKFHTISDVLKEDLKLYATDKFSHLERFLSTFPDDNKLLTVSIEHHEKGNLYDVKCNLQVGGKTIHHEESTHNPKEAIDKSEANLIRQIKKHMEIMRGE
jgi:ribosome-associated translation inhibitor RaiA